jgi:hypothetical protein
MKTSKRFSLFPAAAAPVLAFGLLSLLAGCGGKQEAAAPAAQVNERGYKETTASGISFQWKVDGSELEAVVSAPTQGWVAVGFDPVQMMRGANFIIAYVQNGQVTIADHFGSQLTNHEDDAALGGAANVTAVEGSEANGTTTVTFRIPLDSGDQYDKALVAGQEYQVLLAYGSADDFETQHDQQARTKIRVQL